MNQLKHETRNELNNFTFTWMPLLEGGEEKTCTMKGPIPTRTFVDLLDRHKALVIRSPDNPLGIEDFGHFVASLNLEGYAYIGGAAPRNIIPVSAGKDIIFTANESPPDQPIPFHHELAQCPSPPEYIFFYCDVPAKQGGETPLIDSTLVYRFANEQYPEFIQKLQKHGARYIRTMPAKDDPSSPIGRSYKNTWNVATVEELEEKLSSIEGCSWKWLPDGSVRITSEPVCAIKLVKDHAQNHLFQWTFANSLVAAFLGWQDSRNDRREALCFGNGDRMPEHILQSIADFMEKHKVSYVWNHGDILAINNRLVMHSRNPFEGKRRVLASIWGGAQKEILHASPKNGVALGERDARFFQQLEPSDPLVFGFWKVAKEECEDVCFEAIKAGYRRLDCACDYGNEEEVGKGIAKAIEAGICKRSDLFVTSKLWNTYHHPDHVGTAIARSLSDLGLDYLDEYLIHFPISLEYVPFEEKYPPEWTNCTGEMVVVSNDMIATWSAMEALVDQGLARTIGVCNFSTQLLRQILSTCRIRPSTLQVELHPHNTQEHLIRFAREAGLFVTAFSVFGASSYLSLGMAQETEMILNDQTIRDVAMSKKKTPAQILLRWALQRNTFPLSKTSQSSRMKENRDIFDFYLTASEMDLISTLNRNRRYNDPGDFCQGMGTFCPIYS